MNKFSIFGKRKCFWQWDLGQQLIVLDDECTEVHFANCNNENAYVCLVYEKDGQRVVDVPNVLLQTAVNFSAYTLSESDNEAHTIAGQRFAVYSRPKPADYVYTETEVWTAEKAVADALEEAKASGEFDGADGKDGKDGINGKDGANGYTPVRGVDYWTEADKAEIKSYVDEAILGGAW